VASDNNTLYAAIPSAPITGVSPGAVVQVSLPNSAVTATIPVPGARFVIPSPSGNQILVISDTAGTVSVLAPALISSDPVHALITLAGFDKPVWAVFSSDGSTAYVMNSGPERGGLMAGIVAIDMTQNPPLAAPPVPVPAATTGFINGGNLYVAGTPPSAGVDCQANLCGKLTVFPGANLSATPASFDITDGYHDNLVMAPNNQLFIASRGCTNVIATGTTPGRGCLSVLNTTGGTIYTSSQDGDTTGIQPILNRTVVYVCEGGTFAIYDTALDLGPQRKLKPQTTTVIAVVGQAIDVKLVDF
jgi:DNA-binding beta-propeller fold protein YncE